MRSILLRLERMGVFEERLLHPSETAMILHLQLPTTEVCHITLAKVRRIRSSIRLAIARLVLMHARHRPNHQPAAAAKSQATRLQRVKNLCSAQPNKQCQVVTWHKYNSPPAREMEVPLLTTASRLLATTSRLLATACRL
eukprot:Rmarinus@m.6996